MAKTDDAGLLEPFIRNHIHSAEELETLLILFRAPTRWWTVNQVAHALHLGQDAARQALERLSGAFLEVRIEGDVRFRFAALNPERERLTASLDSAYQRDRTSLMHMIGRHDAARDFADAFRLKKEEP